MNSYLHINLGLVSALTLEWPDFGLNRSDVEDRDWSLEKCVFQLLPCVLILCLYVGGLVQLVLVALISQIKWVNIQNSFSLVLQTTFYFNNDM